MSAQAMLITEIQANKVSTTEAIAKLVRVKLPIKKTAFDLLIELLAVYSQEFILNKLFIHKGTFNRWLTTKKVPQNYFISNAK